MLVWTICAGLEPSGLVRQIKPEFESVPWYHQARARKCPASQETTLLIQDLGSLRRVVGSEPSVWMRSRRSPSETNSCPSVAQSKPATVPVRVRPGTVERVSPPEPAKTAISQLFFARTVARVLPSLLRKT